MTKKMLIPLPPVRIKSDDAAYKSVEELSEVLERVKGYGIKNVALTGPYGSGKSHILNSTARGNILFKVVLTDRTSYDNKKLYKSYAPVSSFLLFFFGISFPCFQSFLKEAYNIFD